MVFWSSSLDMTFGRWTLISFTCSKSFLSVTIHLFQYTCSCLKIPIIISIILKATLVTVYISVFKSFNVYVGMEVFTSFVCKQSQSLTLLLHCNTYHVKHLDHGQYVLFMCLAQQVYIYFSFYRLLSSNTKQINLISDVSIMKHPLRKLRNTEIHRISWALVLLCKYVLCCLDKQWYDRFPIYIITYNLTPVLSIIAWNLSETIILFTLIVIGQLSIFACKKLW